MQQSKYMLAGERDQQWGLFVTTVGYEEIAPGDPYPTRGHAEGYYFDVKKGRTLQEYQLLYIIEGQGQFRSSSVPQWQQLKEGDFFMLFPGEWHTYHPTKSHGWKKFWVGFQGAHIDERVRAGFLSPSHPIHHVGFSDSIVRLYKNSLGYAIGDMPYAQQVMAGVVNLLIGIMLSKERTLELQHRNHLHQDLMNRACLCIRENLESPLTIQEVAERMGMSYSNFRRLFKEYTGFSPAIYQQDLRLQRAKELLTTTNMSIKEIAYQLNFDSPDYFSSKFKAKTGRKPSDLRAAADAGDTTSPSGPHND